MNYKQKYLKYKLKYLKLIGGYSFQKTKHLQTKTLKGGNLMGWLLGLAPREEIDKLRNEINTKINTNKINLEGLQDTTIKLLHKMQNEIEKKLSHIYHILAIRDRHIQIDQLDKQTFRDHVLEMSLNDHTPTQIYEQDVNNPSRTPDSVPTLNLELPSTQ